jgi:hypothetical protein
LLELVRKELLYTGSVSVVRKVKGKMRLYYLIAGRGNDAITPDRSDLERYKRGELTSKGFMLNYRAKLLRPEADEWMRRVASEATSEDVVLVSKEESGDCYRILLAELILNMYSGQMNLRYMGELKEP